MRAALLLLLTLSFISCAVGQNSSVRKSAPPVVKEFTVVSVWRESNNPDRYGISQPPFTEVKFEIIGFDKEPAVNSSVTVIPLMVDLATFDLKIVKATKKEGGCEGGEWYWDVELERVTRREFFEMAPMANRNAEFPFDVCVIYPAVKRARAMKKAELKKAMLPRGVYINAVKAAIDLDGDARPDLIYLRPCCNDPSKSAEDPGTDCYRCSKSYMKSKGVWRLVDESSPC